MRMRINVQKAGNCQTKKERKEGRSFFSLIFIHFFIRMPLPEENASIETGSTASSCRGLSPTDVIALKAVEESYGSLGLEGTESCKQKENGTLDTPVTVISIPYCDDHNKSCEMNSISHGTSSCSRDTTPEMYIEDGIMTETMLKEEKRLKKEEITERKKEIEKVSVLTCVIFNPFLFNGHQCIILLILCLISRLL